MNEKPTPETDTNVGEWDEGKFWDHPKGRIVEADFARKLERERNEAREDLKFKEKLCAELTKQLRKEQQLHVQTLNERDEARKIAAELREALQFVATDKIANAADMRCRAARALEFCPENEKSPCAGATKMKS
jgi:hypothetical protein